MSCDSYFVSPSPLLYTVKGKNMNYDFTKYSFLVQKRLNFRFFDVTLKEGVKFRFSMSATKNLLDNLKFTYQVWLYKSTVYKTGVPFNAKEESWKVLSLAASKDMYL